MTSKSPNLDQLNFPIKTFKPVFYRIVNKMTRADYSASLNTLLNNFQHNFGPLSDLCIDKIRHNSVSLWTRYCLDFIISHFIIAPAVIAFWRGTWDHSTIYWDKVFGDGELTLIKEVNKCFSHLNSCWLSRW